MSKTIYSVAQVNNYIKNMFAQDYLLGSITVRGEVSNLKYHSSGHIYFSIKDQSAVLSCVMFAGARRQGLRFQMVNGQRVVITGSVNVYERDGKYQLYAQHISLDGVGTLYERFEALKEELSERGLFAAEYKQPIPKYIRTLGVVTAPTGAAVQDIIRISLRRNPYLKIILYPALVQGEGAAQSVARGIAALEAYGVDCMIVGRGGGSIEDLWAFNEEIVAQAIFDCEVPIISAVGHETDFTIADFAADQRASTPSAGAELAVFEYDRFLQDLKEKEDALFRAVLQKLNGKRQRLSDLEVRLSRFRPEHQFRSYRTKLSAIEERMHRAVALSVLSDRQRLDQLEEKLQSGMKNSLDQARQELLLAARRLEAVSPLNSISRGYAYVQNDEGKKLTKLEDASAGDLIRITMTDGMAEARIEKIHLK